MRRFFLLFMPVLVFVAGYFTGKKKVPGPPTKRSDSEPSASSTSVTGNNYYIFLSFRGPDTRNGFVDHLYHKLRDMGLPFHPNFVFRDDNDLPVGEDINDNLISAIKHSAVSIPIISENYAASEWCLRELIEIMECKKNNGQIVLPVFYNVKPYEVRELLGAFGKAFRSRMHRFKKEDVKQKGPAALTELVESRVFESEKTTSGREGDLVNKLVEMIKHKMQQEFSPSLPADLVGFDDHVANVTRLADTAPSKVQPIVIFGIGGIGKTTLATSIYKKLFYDFEFCSFLKDTRETIKSKGMEHVQSLLISDLTKSPADTVRDSEIGINRIRISCANKKVLLLLDDVECQENLNKLIGGCNFGSGSKIIITCREKAVLNSTYQMYELPPMNRRDSLLLFYSHAFKGEQPPRKFVALSCDIVDTTGGLPLALVTVGSLLKGETKKSIWTETLEKLRRVSNNDVRNMLKISYDSLGYEEQQMFLDIACFFIGIDKRIPIYLWKDLKFFPSAKLQALIDRSSIIVDDNNKLRMHDQLRDLGRAITRPAAKKPWDCSRLWDEEAVTVQLSEDENRNIEALRLDQNGSTNFMERKRFKKMPFLKFLRLSEVDLDKDLEGSLSELRWLEWKMCRDSFNATHVPSVKLLILDLSGGYISHGWSGWGLMKMERLKVLNLSWCSHLTNTPDLSAFGNLEMLILENCENLEKIGSSIGDLKHLVSLNLRYCGSLKVLPAELGKLKELEELVVDETDIQEIPPCIGSLEKLKTLSALGCRLLTRVPSSISRLVNLSTLNLNTCKKLPGLPDSFQALGKLQRLRLERCYMLRELPPSIGELGELVELDLSSTGIKELPESIDKLHKLKILRISHSKIEKLPRAIEKLQSLHELDASGCHKLEGQVLVNIRELSTLVLKTLRLGRAKISHLPENFCELSTLVHLDLLYCSELRSLPKPPSSLSCLQLTCRSKKLPSLSHLRHLKQLTLHSCMSLQSIPELPSCIQELRVCKCPELKSLPKLSNLKSLLELELLQCYGLKELNGLEALESLRKLDVSLSTDLSNLNDLEDLASLRDSDTQYYGGEADNLCQIPGLGQLKSLEVLNISARKHIENLDLSNSVHLKQLIVNNCQRLAEIRILLTVEPLERFDRDGCQAQIIRLSKT